MSTPAWYVDWVDRHRTAFLLPDEWVEAAVVWWDTFERAAVPAADLHAATAALMADPTRPRFAADHLPRVTALVGGLRDRREAERVAARRREWGEEHGVCADCGDTGTVVVPHPRAVRAGCWEPSHHRKWDGSPVYVTAAVACGCPRGRAATGQMTLADYSLNVLPDWRTQAAGVAAEAERRAGVVDRAAAVLGVADIAAGVGTPVGGNGRAKR